MQLSGNKFSLRGVKALANGICRSTALFRTVRVCCCTTLSDDDCAELVRGLTAKTSLRHLYLKDSNCGVETAQAVAECLQRHQCLESIDLSENQAIGHAGARVIFDALARNTVLKELRLTKTKLVDGSALTALNQNTTLEMLVLNGATRAGRRLGAVFFFFSRQCADNAIDEAGMTLLAQSVRRSRPPLKCLAMSGKASEHATLVALALAGNVTLTTINLLGVLTTDGMEAFAASMERNHHIFRVGVSKQTVFWPRIEDCVKRNTNISWQTTHLQLLGFCLALTPLDLPPYIMLEIFDFVSHLPEVGSETSDC